MAHVTGLYMYPVKSCAGTPLDAAELDARGIVHDREFMLVGADRRFLTQREVPRLALIRPTRGATSLGLTAPGMAPISVEPTDAGQRFEATIWRDRVVVADQGNAAAGWLGEFVGVDCRLVRMPADVVRPVDPQYATGRKDQVGLTDGFPLLLISEESLADLNGRLAEALPMNRFRPNVVIQGVGAPYAEDGWSEIRIGDVACRVVKACARCVTTTTDQLTAERGAEPLATLATYRRVPRGVVFGQNAIHRARGRIAIGDRVEVLGDA